MFSVLMLLALKAASLVHGGGALLDPLIAPVRAQDAKDQAEAEKPAEEKPAEEKPTEEKPAEEKPAESASSGGGEAASEEKSGEKKEEDKPGTSKAQGTVNTEPPPKEDPASGRSLAPGGRVFSPLELQILQDLSARRIQLDGWEKEVEVKEALLTVTEKRVDEKIASIEAMRKELEAMIGKHTEEEDAKIRSLVKIYENMKPRDAARIFDEVEMPILLLVVDRMAEKKAAPILASMDPKKAKQLTVELADQRRVQQQTMQAPPPRLAPTPAGR